MDHLRAENFESAHSLLKKAEEVLSNSESTAHIRKLQSITMNNLGCFYKRKGNPTVALQYLNKSLLYDKSGDVTNQAGTNLNI
jgi:hypothetical protein